MNKVAGFIGLGVAALASVGIVNSLLKKDGEVLKLELEQHPHVVEVEATVETDE